ncbi:outer membrane lipoprotein carrier protein LolA [Microtetraspora fusca]|uniref:Outer membrane lipoprotein carrier protein LolA n=1 Tax=Microtetraspora fusca TaxID=1997 RepID=A0ABW6VAV3_MICFU
MRIGTRAVRWGVPVAAVAVVAGIAAAGPVIAAAQGEPSLPRRTAAELLADAAERWQSGRLPQMSGTIVETASLGLPALPAAGGATSPLGLLSGSHQAKVWYGGPDRLRLMVPDEMSESDLVVNGDQVWWWDSAANTATRIKGAPDGAGRPDAVPYAGTVTPRQAAEEALRAAGADTEIAVGEDASVAGRAAYQVVLTPKNAGSLVKEVRLAIDGETLVPLRVQLYAKGAAEPAFEVGFDSVTFTPPAPENFAFTPPPGAKVEESTAPPIARVPHGKDGEIGLDGHDGAAPRVVGDGWDRVVVVSVPKRFEGDVAGAADRAKGGRDGDGVASLADGMLNAATPVSGEWGSGRLIRTKLVTALLTDDGRLLAGAVTPEVLYAAAAAK